MENKIYCFSYGWAHWPLVQRLWRETGCFSLITLTRTHRASERQYSMAFRNTCHFFLKYYQLTCHCLYRLILTRWDISFYFYKYGALRNLIHLISNKWRHVDKSYILTETRWRTEQEVSRHIQRPKPQARNGPRSYRFWRHVWI